ncbi:hypothetical protein J6590_067596 [Homalodisca vitripennis]|nr:hypothetical protein J6590_067596 [Homalodisca vitripennis]
MHLRTLVTCLQCTTLTKDENFPLKTSSTLQDTNLESIICDITSGLRARADLTFEELILDRVTIQISLTVCRMAFTQSLSMKHQLCVFPRGGAFFLHEQRKKICYMSSEFSGHVNHVVRINTMQRIVFWLSEKKSICLWKKYPCLSMFQRRLVQCRVVHEIVQEIIEPKCLKGPKFNPAHSLICHARAYLAEFPPLSQISLEFFSDIQRGLSDRHVEMPRPLQCCDFRVESDAEINYWPPGD